MKPRAGDIVRIRSDIRGRREGSCLSEGAAGLYLRIEYGDDGNFFLQSFDGSYSQIGGTAQDFDMVLRLEYAIIQL